MNRRQKKKAYKKKYGYNPPKTEMRYHKKYWGRVYAKTCTIYVPNFITMLTCMAKKMASVIKQTTKIIQEMPEEQFTFVVEKAEMSPKAKAMAKMIRETGIGEQSLAKIGIR